jgi:hypothetical protein
LEVETFAGLECAATAGGLAAATIPPLSIGNWRRSDKFTFEFPSFNT